MCRFYIEVAALSCIFEQWLLANISHLHLSMQSLINQYLLQTNINYNATLTKANTHLGINTIIGFIHYLPHLFIFYGN